MSCGLHSLKFVSFIRTYLAIIESVTIFLNKQIFLFIFFRIQLQTLLFMTFLINR